MLALFTFILGLLCAPVYKILRDATLDSKQMRMETWHSNERRQMRLKD
jgi:hypothetical protein